MAVTAIASVAMAKHAAQVSHARRAMWLSLVANNMIALHVATAQAPHASTVKRLIKLCCITSPQLGLIA